MGDRMLNLKDCDGVGVVYDANEMEGIHYSGSIRNLRIDQFFDFIYRSIPIEVELNEDSILLSLLDKK